MPLYLFYTMVQKSQKWPKTQIKGSCLNSPSSPSALWHKHFPHVTVCEIQSRRWLGGALDKTNGVGTLEGTYTSPCRYPFVQNHKLFFKRQADQEILRQVRLCLLKNFASFPTKLWLWS